MIPLYFVSVTLKAWICFSSSWSFTHWKFSWGQKGSGNSKNHSLSRGTIEQVANVAIIAMKHIPECNASLFDPGLYRRFYLTNRFHIAVRLFNNRLQMTSKCGKNKQVAHGAIAECVTDVAGYRTPA